MSGFLGKYEFQMDEKGRVSLPSAFRREAEGDRFVLLQWEKPYLTLFPSSVWADVQQRLLEFRKREPTAWNVVREIVSNAVDVAPDKQGRILVPAWLKEAANLGGSVLLNGNIDRVELWDPETYRSQVQAPAAADVLRFAHQVFG
jgi:MraZ protein